MELPPTVGSDEERIGEKGTECQVFGEITRKGLIIGVGTRIGAEFELSPVKWVSFGFGFLRIFAQVSVGVPWVELRPSFTVIEVFAGVMVYDSMSHYIG